MNKNKSLTSKLPLRQRIILVLSGVFLLFIFLETGLHLGGFIQLSIQEYHNLQSIKQKGTYRIMCLGESTTQGQYPRFLEQALNQRNIGVRFSVIDKGRVGTNTRIILSQVEAYLKEYHPDMVVAMMGCNDGRVMYYQDIPEVNTWMFRNCRVYRFSRIIYMHILNKLKQDGIFGLNKSLENTKTATEENKLSKIEESFKKATELNPKNDNAYIELGQFYQDQGKFFQGEDAFKKAIKLNPKNDKAYVGLGWLYRNQDKYFLAEDVLQKAIELNPKNYDAYIELGQIYQAQRKFSQAEDAFKRAVELNPKNDKAYPGLDWAYRKQGKFSQDEAVIKKAIELNPKKDNAYVRLGNFYLQINKLSQAEAAFKKAIEVNPKNDRAHGALAVLYQEMGKPELAEEYARKANTSSSGYCNIVTFNNYHKLKEILDKRGVQLVCVQYPMRNVELLKIIFEPGQGIIFVDNESIFKEAVNKSSYNEYFRDIFGGDFGHCTEKGNRLLANNIASVILKEVFKK